MSTSSAEMTSTRLTPLQWTICITAAIGFAFDSYVLLMLPLIVRPALVDLLHRLSLLAEEVPEVAELDLNPVIALPDRCVAVDARVRVRRPDTVARTKSW